MNIGEAASLSGVSAKMIRYYESIGLIAKVERTRAGYRTYSEADVHTLRFIRNARELGFSVADISELLALWQDRERHSSEVRRLAQGHLAQLNAKVASLQAMAQTLSHLVECCHGDERPECPILAELASPNPSRPPRTKH